MNWRVHRISTNRTFKQFMNAGYRSNGIRTQNIIDICSTISMLCGRKLMMWMDLIFIHAIWGCHTLNVIQLHQLTNPSSHLSKRKTPTYQNRKFYRIYYLGIPPFQFPSPNPLNFPISSPQKLFFFWENCNKKRKAEWKEMRRRKTGWRWIDKWEEFEKPNCSGEEQVLFFVGSLFLSLPCAQQNRERKWKENRSISEIRCLMDQSNGKYISLVFLFFVVVCFYFLGKFTFWVIWLFKVKTKSEL